VMATSDHGGGGECCGAAAFLYNEEGYHCGQ